MKHRRTKQGLLAVLIVVCVVAAASPWAEGCPPDCCRICVGTKPCRQVQMNRTFDINVDVAREIPRDQRGGETSGNTKACEHTVQQAKQRVLPIDSLNPSSCHQRHGFPRVGTAPSTSPTVIVAAKVVVAVPALIPIDAAQIASRAIAVSQEPAIQMRCDPVSELASSAAEATRPQRLTNSIGMRLALIPAGQFAMGSTDDDVEKILRIDPSFEREWAVAEQPQHTVGITRPFYLGVHEVTKGQFAEFERNTGYVTEAERDKAGGWGLDSASGQSSQQPAYSWRNTGVRQDSDHPVVNVSWQDAQAFCQWLARRESRPYRLPTEAEWEYAARAGSSTLFPWGDELAAMTEHANAADKAWQNLTKHKSGVLRAADDDGFAFTSPVGSFHSNPCGIYDMIGNVWEWCQDVYDPDYYKSSPSSDPSGPPSEAGAAHVIRGGAWYITAGTTRSAYRYGLTAGYHYHGLGFRVCFAVNVPANGCVSPRSSFVRPPCQ